MKTLALISCMASLIQAADRLPAFPGAEGAGKWTSGGRGGRVTEVTTLDDSGPGSLRAALDAREPRTVIFRVSGTIELKAPLRVLHPFITIAGQTAPGDGICLKGYELQIGTTHDVIVRHLRCRPGDKTSKPGDMDALTIWDAQNVIVDHCSATWSTDECLSVTRDTDRITVQHCLIAEALTEHGLGSIIGSYHGDISYLHNLYASNRARNPRPSGYQSTQGHENDPGPRIDFRNNVLFNWQSGAGYTGSDNADEPERIAMNYVGNYLKPGADTSPTYQSLALTIYAGSTAELFLEGNRVDKPQRSINMQSELLMIRPGCTLILRDKPLPFEPVTAQSDPIKTLDTVGAVKPKRDAVDARIIAGVRDGTGRLPTSFAPDAWPELKSGESMPDTDHDGLPDAWEQAHGLNPNDPSDSSKPSLQAWTYLELWMNSL